jgi:hypothetical protein
MKDNWDNIKDYLPKGFVLLKQDDKGFEVSYGPYIAKYDESKTDRYIYLLRDGKNVGDEYYIGYSRRGVHDFVRWLGSKWIKVDADLPTIREVLPNICKTRSGNLKQYFDTPCVVAWVKGYGFCYMIIKKKLGAYKGVRCTTKGYDCGTDTIDVSKALKEMEEMLKYSTESKELPDEDKQKLVAEMI